MSIWERRGCWSTYANRLREGRKVPRNGDNGLLTAFEVAALDLRNTDLVVLHGCDTGLGEASLSRGVVGFRQALRIAGARLILSSLWEVDEDATAVLMEELFRNYFNGVEAVDALRMAKERVQQTPGWEHPHFWAGFVLEADSLHQGSQALLQ